MTSATPCTVATPCGPLVVWGAIAEIHTDLDRAHGSPPQRVYRCLGCGHDRWDGIPADLQPQKRGSDDQREAARQNLVAARAKRWQAKARVKRWRALAKLPPAFREMLTRVPLARRVDRVPTPTATRSGATKE